MKKISLDDWMTTESNPFGTKTTEIADDVLHSHNFYEIFYIIDGSIRHELNGHVSILHIGDMIFLNKTDCHIFLREAGNTCKHRDIILRSNFFHTLCDFIGPDFYENYNKNKYIKLVNISPEKINEFETCLLNIITLQNGHPLKNELINSFSVALLNQLLFSQVKTSQYCPSWIEEIISRFSMIEFASQGLNKILEPYNYNRSYMCRMFHKYTGSTMNEYLNMIRINYSATMLKFTEKTILEISTDLGFSSVSYFNSIFKKTYHMTPSEFRKNTSEKKMSKTDLN